MYDAVAGSLDDIHDFTRTSPIVDESSLYTPFLHVPRRESVREQDTVTIAAMGWS
jgi:hypothetical protein